MDRGAPGILGDGDFTGLLHHRKLDGTASRIVAGFNLPDGKPEGFVADRNESARRFDADVKNFAFANGNPSPFQYTIVALAQRPVGVKRRYLELIQNLQCLGS